MSGKYIFCFCLHKSNTECFLLTDKQKPATRIVLHFPYHETKGHKYVNALSDLVLLLLIKIVQNASFGFISKEIARLNKSSICYLHIMLRLSVVTH